MKFNYENNHDQKRISVIGCGRLGLTFALLCEKNGYEVIGCDKREDYVERLNDKTHKTSEPQIENLLQTLKNFTATTDIKLAITFSELLFVFVPTPSKENGEYDHQYIEEVVNDLIAFDDNGNSISGKTLIIGCTVMPMYCKQLQERLELFGVSVVYSPEFIAQGSIVKDLENADLVLIGCEPEYDLIDLLEVYGRIMKINPEFKILSLTAAEITKISINCFLTTKISYANMIAEIAIKSGEEESVSDILKTIGSDSRIGNKYLNYGFGYGGPCLVRDNRALGIHANKVGVKANVPKEVDEFNMQHLQFLKEKFTSENSDKNVPFIFNQLCYKKGVDMLTESQHYKLCIELLEEGYSVNIAESEIIIELVKPILNKYGDKVTYGNGNGQVSHFEERIVQGQKARGFVIDL